MIWRVFFVFLLVNVHHVTLSAEEGKDEEEIDECEKKPDGLYAVRDYSKYLQCYKKKGVEHSCQKDHIYKAETKSCVPKNEIDLDSFCHSRKTGDYMNPWSDCSKYIHCVFGWTHVLECEKGLLYDPESDECRTVSSSPHCYQNKVKPSKNKRKHNRRYSINRVFPPDTPSSPDSPFSPDSIYPPDSPVLPDPPESPDTNDSAQDVGNGNETDENGNPIQKEENLISAEDLRERLKTGNLRVVDVREPWELLGFGKIETSYNIPVGEIKEAFSLNDNEFKTKYGFEKPLINDCNLVFYCQSGIRSYKALLIAKELGYICPKSLKGGYRAWSQLVYGKVDDNPVQLPENLITPNELREKLLTTSVRLVDVREPWEVQQFGKIDHSVNIPVDDMKEAFTLNENDFKTKYGIDKPSPDDCNLFFHCQSGIRSYKALLIAKTLGYNCSRSLQGGHNAWKEMEDSLLGDCENPVKKENENSIISPKELKEKLEGGDVRVIDVREYWEIEKYGKIEHSFNIPVEEVTMAFRMNNEEFKNRYNYEKPFESDCNLIFYCQSGIRSCKAVVMVMTLGYTCPKSLTGGYKAWEDMIKGTEDKNETATSNTDLISPENLKHGLQNNQVILIDVREKWELDTEGKIAQSVHIPLNEIETAFHLSNSEFKSKYGIEKPGLNDCNLVFHCRSGVRSYDAVKLVKAIGYTCPKSLDGGFIAWKNILP